MTIIKRSDVKNHLSTRASSVVLPFKPASRPGTTGDAENELHSTKPSVLDSGNPVETTTTPEKL